MSIADYLSLLDWMARQVRSDQLGATPQHPAPIFDRLDCPVAASAFIACVCAIDSRFDMPAPCPRKKSPQTV